MLRIRIVISLGDSSLTRLLLSLFHRDLAVRDIAIPGDGRFRPASSKDAGAHPGFRTHPLGCAVVCIPLCRTRPEEEYDAPSECATARTSVQMRQLAREPSGDTDGVRQHPFEGWAVHQHPRSSRVNTQNTKWMGCCHWPVCERLPIKEPNPGIRAPRQQELGRRLRPLLLGNGCGRWAHQVRARQLPRRWVCHTPYLAENGLTLCNRYIPAVVVAVFACWTYLRAS